jgi:hypothetical protein
MTTLSFKVTPQEAARIRLRAKREGRSISEFLRLRAMESETGARLKGNVRITTSPATGLPVMTGPAGTPPVGPDQIRALLLDFP